MKKFILLLVTSISLLNYNFGQGKYYKKVEEIVSWQPPTNTISGSSFTATIRIVHDVFFGDATEQHVIGRFKLGSTVIYKNQVINTSNLPEDVIKKFKLNSAKIAYDIKNNQNEIVCTKTIGNVIDIDMAGSPAWSKIFPGLTAEQAKDLFKSGYSIVNVRILDASVSIPNLDAYVTGKTTAQNTPTTPNNTTTNNYWEEVAYQRNGDTIFINKSNGQKTYFIVCKENTSNNTNSYQPNGGSNDLPNLPIATNYYIPRFSAESASYCLKFKWTACPNLGKSITIMPDGSINQDLQPEIAYVIIQYRKKGDLVWTTLKGNGNCVIPFSAYIEPNVEPCTVYEYRGMAVYENKTMSEMSGVGNISTQCFAPFNLRAENVSVNTLSLNFRVQMSSTGSIFLNSDCNTKGKETYVVEYSSNGMQWESFEYVNGKLVIQNLQPATNYQVRVRSKYANNKLSAYSNVITVQTKAQ
ncbi:MAG: fibronectin type III domain-containing protein [Chitinophagaceae bacterium]